MAKNKNKPRKVSKEEPSTNDETEEGKRREGERLRQTSMTGIMKAGLGGVKEVMNIQK